MKNEYQQWLQEEYVPIMGGDDPLADPATPPEDPPSDPQGGDPPVKPQPPDDSGNWIPKGRFDQVNNANRAYKEFGKPEEVKARLDKLTEWEKQVDAYNEDQKLTQQQRDDKASREEIAKQLRELLPELAGLNEIGDLKKAVEKITTSGVEKNLSSASVHLAELLKKENIEVDAGTHDRLEDYIWVRMTDEGREAMQQGDYSEIDEVFKQELEEGLLAKYKPQPGPTPLPRRHKTGGTPPQKPKEPIKTFEDAEKIVNERLGFR